MRSASGSFSWMLSGLLALSLGGCRKLEQQQKDRDATRLEGIEADYEELAFILEQLDEGERKQTSCDDDSLPRHKQGSARICRRIALVDEGYARKLFQPDAKVDADRVERWEWMRTGGFEALKPLSEIDGTNDISRHAREIEGFDRTLVGVFTMDEASTDPKPKSYEGWLVLFDTEDKAIRCQLRVELDVEKIYDPPTRQRGFSTVKDSPREHIDAFWRKLDKELRNVTKNFCAD